MTDLGLLDVAAVGTPLPDSMTALVPPGERLYAATMRMAGRLAVLLETLDATAPRIDFLRSLAATVMASAGPGDGSALDLPSPGNLHPIDRAAATLGMDAADLDLVVLTLLPGEHEGLAAVARDLHPDGRPEVTGGLAASLAEMGLLGSEVLTGGAVARREAVRTRLTVGALVRSGLLQTDERAPFSEATLVPGAAVAAALRGFTIWPDGCREIEVAVPTAGLDQWAAGVSARAASEAFQRREPVVAVTHSARPVTTASRVAALAARSGLGVAVLRIDRRPASALTNVALHAMLAGVVPVILIEEPGTVDIPCSAAPWPLALCLGPDVHLHTWPRPTIVLPSDPLTRGDRADAVEVSFGPRLSGHLPIVPAYADTSDIAEIATNLGATSRLSGQAVTTADVMSHLDRLAIAAPPAGSVIVHPSAGLRDLIVSDDVSVQLAEAQARLDHRDMVLDHWGFLAGRPGRRGLRMLFHGPPGTGKTLAAEVLSSALGCDLLVVDLSQMVSKWIGETEKHLADAFTFAERTGSALFFDEADALFGRRTEVGDARDRYANLETSYLLSRIERYEGLVILATNLRQNLDGAFTRRLDFVVGFDPPDVTQREALWRRLLPQDAPLDHDVDLGRVAARYAVTGGIIRGAAVAAAYLAAARGGPIRIDDIVHALEREYAKSGQHFPGPRHPTPEHP